MATPRAHDIVNDAADAALFESNIPPTSMAGGDANLHSQAGEPDPESAEALDKLFAGAAKTDDDAGEVKPAEDDDAGEVKPAEAEPVQPVKDDAQPPVEEVKPATDDAQPPAKPAEDNEFDKVVLPPHSSPSAAKSFDTVKQLARDKVAAAELKAAEIAKQLQELKEEVAKRPPAEASKELEELREWRRKLDIEQDPVFQSKFDKRAASIEEKVLGRMKQVGASDAQLEKLKSLGVKGVNWEPVLRRLDPANRRFIELKLAELDEVESDRKSELERANGDSSKFLKELEESRSSEIHRLAEQAVKPLRWLQDQPIPASATDEERKTLQERNRFAGQLREKLKTFTSSRSPEVHADLAVGTVLAHKLANDVEFLKGQLAAAETVKSEVEKTVSEITKERDALRSELDKIKKAGGLNRGARPASTAPVKSAVKIEDGETAIDRLFREKVGGV